MATLTVTPTDLVVRFTRFEKVFGLVRDHSFPLSAVTDATVEPKGFAAVRGLRAPGLALPGRVLVGTWRGRGRTLVAVRRDEPAVVVELTGQGFDQLVVGTADAADLVARLGART